MNNFAYIWKSALGWAVVSGSIAGIKRFDFGYCEKSELLKESKNHYHKIPALCLGEIVRMNKVKELTAIDSSPSWMRIAVKQIDEYFTGKNKRFSFELDTDGTEFQKKVWGETARIPYGQTVSYSELAAKTGSPRAARAIGAAMGANPIPVIVPCHRVIGADGALRGFAMGLDIKKKLLDLEKSAL